MPDLREAIQARFEAQTLERAERQPYTPDPHLEQLGAKLDALRETNPSQYDNPTLAQTRSLVETYRRRKAAHEEKR